MEPRLKLRIFHFKLGSNQEPLISRPALNPLSYQGFQACKEEFKQAVTEVVCHKKWQKIMEVYQHTLIQPLIKYAHLCFIFQREICFIN